MLPWITEISNFSTCFRLMFVSLWFFHLIFAYFTFVFASDFWRFASKWIMWNQAFFSLPSETKFSLQFQISLPKRKWGRTLPRSLSAAWYKFDIIWLYCSPIPVRRRGVFNLFEWFLPAFPALWGGGGCLSHLEKADIDLKHPMSDIIGYTDDIISNVRAHLCCLITESS